MASPPATLRERYVTVFAGKRDYYQVPVALHEAGALDRLVTDLYCPDWLEPVARLLPGRTGEKVLGRRHPQLPSRAVISPAMLASLRDAARGRPNVDKIGEAASIPRRLGLVAGRRAGAHGLAAVVYSYYWEGFLEGAADNKRGTSVLFQLHPMPRQVREIMARDREGSDVGAPLRDEELLPPGDVDAYERRILEADAVLVPSRFVAQGVEAAGYPPERIFRVAYGGDFGPRLANAGLAAETRERAGSRPLRLLFVGQLAYRKGFHHLLEAVSGFSPSDVTLTMICRDQRDRSSIGELPPTLDLRGGVSEAELARIYRSHDLFVLPSLVEGFGLVYLEAMSLGLPVICTDNTGGPDVLLTGEEGTSVKAGDADALRRAIAAYAEDRGRLEAASQQALATARGFTWTAFRKGVVEALASAEHLTSGSGPSHSPAAAQ